MAPSGTVYTKPNENLNFWTVKSSSDPPEKIFSLIICKILDFFLI